VHRTTTRVEKCPRTSEVLLFDWWTLKTEA